MTWQHDLLQISWLIVFALIHLISLLHVQSFSIHPIAQFTIRSHMNIKRWFRILQFNVRTRQESQSMTFHCTWWDIVISPQSDTILYVPEKLAPLPFCSRSTNAAASLWDMEFNSMMNLIYLNTFFWRRILMLDLWKWERRYNKSTAHWWKCNDG